MHLLYHVQRVPFYICGVFGTTTVVSPMSFVGFFYVLFCVVLLYCMHDPPALLACPHLSYMQPRPICRHTAYLPATNGNSHTYCTVTRVYHERFMACSPPPSLSTCGDERAFLAALSSASPDVPVTKIEARVPDEPVTKVEDQVPVAKVKH